MKPLACLSEASSSTGFSYHDSSFIPSRGLNQINSPDFCKAVFLNAFLYFISYLCRGQETPAHGGGSWAEHRWPGWERLLGRGG